MKNQYLPFENVIVSHCELCKTPLNADEVYGTDDIDLCRLHHEKFFQLLRFISTGKIVSLFEVNEVR